MSGHEGLPAEGPSRKGKERHRVMETGNLGQKQSFLKLFFPFLRISLFSFVSELTGQVPL